MRLVVAMLVGLGFTLAGDFKAMADEPPGITGRLWFYNNTTHPIVVRVEGEEEVLPVEFTLRPGGKWKVSTMEWPPVFRIQFAVGKPIASRGRVGVPDGRGDRFAVFRSNPEGKVYLSVFRPLHPSA